MSQVTAVSEASNCRPIPNILLTMKSSGTFQVTQNKTVDTTNKQTNHLRFDIWREKTLSYSDMDSFLRPGESFGAKGVCSTLRPGVPLWHIPRRLQWLLLVNWTAQAPWQRCPKCVKQFRTEFNRLKRNIVLSLLPLNSSLFPSKLPLKYAHVHTCTRTRTHRHACTHPSGSGRSQMLGVLQRLSCVSLALK